jgi:hypothetical protein
MESGLNLTQLVALAAALGWASGLRLYAVVFITGAIGWLGWVTLPAGLSLLQHPVVLGASFLMFLMEFVADKIPGLDSLWDAVHTFIRIPAGAALAAGVFGGDSAAWMLVAALAGGTLAATAHTAKTTTRAAVNTSHPSRISACRWRVTPRCRRCCGWPGSSRCGSSWRWPFRCWWPWA